MSAKGSTLFTVGTLLRHAQDAGAPVRLLVQGTWLDGRIVGADGLGVVLDDGNAQQVLVRLDSIVAVSFSTGRHRRPRRRGGRRGGPVPRTPATGPDRGRPGRRLTGPHQSAACHRTARRRFVEVLRSRSSQPPTPIGDRAGYVPVTAHRVGDALWRGGDVEDRRARCSAWGRCCGAPRTPAPRCSVLVAGSWLEGRVIGCDGLGAVLDDGDGVRRWSGSTRSSAVQFSPRRDGARATVSAGARSHGDGRARADRGRSGDGRRTPHGGEQHFLTAGPR